MKVLIDTSAWSLALRRQSPTSESEQIRTTIAALIEDSLVEMIGPIRQELLSGISKKDQFDKLKHRLSAFIDIPITTKDYELAAEFANSCRKRGIQGSHIDFLICAVAVNNRLAILTCDKDFEHYAKHIPIRLYSLH